MSTVLRFTVEEYDRMIDQGIFSDRHDGPRLELIHGEIREMTPPNPPHDDTIDLLNYWSVDHAPRDRVRVRIQNSLGIPALDSVPLPDVAWMRARSCRKRRPEPGDVLLLIEVAESSLAYDRGEKADLYAASGIKDYWIVNLIDLCIELFRKPRAGKYRDTQTYHIGQSVRPLALPEVSLNVGYVLRNSGRVARPEQRDGRGSVARRTTTPTTPFGVPQSVPPVHPTRGRQRAKKRRPESRGLRPPHFARPGPSFTR